LNHRRCISCGEILHTTLAGTVIFAPQNGDCNYRRQNNIIAFRHMYMLHLLLHSCTSRHDIWITPMY